MTGVAGYRIYDASSGIELADTIATTYTLTDLSPSDTYRYYVVAYGKVGNISEPSNTAITTVMPTGIDVLTDFGGSVTLSFASVSSDGRTTMATSDYEPATQTGFELNGVYYDFDTTATYAGPITVTLPYDPSSVEDPLTLAIYHYDAALDTWVDVTTEIDTINHTITGVVDSLSWFAVGRPNRDFEFREPVNSDGSSIFQIGQTVPVKFQLTDQDGNSVSDVIARIYLAKVSNGIAGTEQEANATNAPDSGNAFRYNSSFNQYIFNLGTKNLSAGTWKIRVSLDDGVSYTVLISLLAK